MSSPSRWPSLFPPRIYELTYRMLEHAVHAELADLTIINLTESAGTCQLIVDQCIALADCILDRRSSPPWPPTEKVLRVFAAATVSGLENSGEKIARTGPPAATSDAVYAYLARVVAGGEPATQVFPPGESVILPAWTHGRHAGIPPARRRPHLAGPPADDLGPGNHRRHELLRPRRAPVPRPPPLKHSK